MSALKNAKHEHFAKLIFSGVNVTEAYAECGYAPTPASASRLLKNAKIQARLVELHQRIQLRHDVTLDSINEELSTAIAAAANRGQFAAVMAGIMGKAKLHGLIIDKQKVEQGRLDGMDDDAIADDIESRLAVIAERRAEGVGEAGGGAGTAAESEPDSELQAVSEAEGVPRQGQDA